ncbi:unnamed protein product, partial [Didymodactylos carnosus]
YLELFKMTDSLHIPEWKSTAATLFNPYLNVSNTKVPRTPMPRAYTLTNRTYSDITSDNLSANNSTNICNNTRIDVVPTNIKSQVVSKRKLNTSDDVAIYVQQMIHSQFCGRSGTPSDVRYDDKKLRTNKSRITSGKSERHSAKQQKQHDPDCPFSQPLNDFFSASEQQMSRMFENDYSSDSIDVENVKVVSRTKPSVTLGAMCGIALTIGDKMAQSKEKVGLEAIRGFRLPSARLQYDSYEHHPMTAAAVLGEREESEPLRIADVLNDDSFEQQQMIEIVNDSYNSSRTSLQKRQIKSSLSEKENHNSVNQTRNTPVKHRSQSSRIFSKGNDIQKLKDWRGKITRPNLPDVRSRLKRQNSGIISPPRPCTAASTLSKSRPDSVALNSTDSIFVDTTSRKNTFDREDNSPTTNAKSAPTSSLKSPGKLTRRQHPLNVRIGQTLVRSVSDEKLTSNSKTNTETPSDRDPFTPTRQMFSEMTGTDNLTGDYAPRPTPDDAGRSSGFTYSTEDQLMVKPTHTRLTSSEDLIDDMPTVEVRGNYKLIKSSTGQVYKTIDSSYYQQHQHQSSTASKQFPATSQLSELNLTQLELLENYDPGISEKIGAAFIPVQILARPKDAADVCSMTINEIEQKYPKKSGQPVFNLPRSHTSINIAQTLQLTKSKRLPVTRQTTLECRSNEEEMKSILNIVPYENQQALVIRTVAPPPPTRINDFLRHTNSTRTSWKNNQTNSNSSEDRNYLSVLARSLDEQWAIFDQLQEDERMQLLEKNLSVLNIRTKQEVVQMRKSPTKKYYGDTNPTVRPVKKLSIITGNDQNQTQRNKLKQGRPIPSVFLTQDPDEAQHAASIYYQARKDTDIKRVFKGFVEQNYSKRLSAEERKRREQEQMAAIKIQRAYRDHLKRRTLIENRSPDTSWKDHYRQHRRALSAKKAVHVEDNIFEQQRIHHENDAYLNKINDTGPSVQIFASFNDIDEKFSRKTLARAAICIQRWWRGHSVRNRLKNLKQEVARAGFTWTNFSQRYRQVIRRIQELRGVEKPKFVFNTSEARAFLIHEKKLTTICKALSFNNKIDVADITKLFEYCDLSASNYEIKEALDAVALRRFF